MAYEVQALLLLIYELQTLLGPVYSISSPGIITPELASTSNLFACSSDELEAAGVSEAVHWPWQDQELSARFSFILG